MLILDTDFILTMVAMYEFLIYHVLSLQCNIFVYCIFDRFAFGPTYFRIFFLRSICRHFCIVSLTNKRNQPEQKKILLP